ncbi:FCD domain-containing protein [Ramlibacter sp. AN1015]|uniref:FadR/GntR family transcriptional regulator n=1 Tax=Ramlibacter sp. AN1015 TaxID=3133428 RepID=UPI0030C3199D
MSRPAPPMNVRQRAREAGTALHRHVVGRIGSGQLKAGDRLPTERELVAMFGGGRGTVRRVLGELESQGLIGREVGRGTFVRGPAAAVLRSGGPLGALRDGPAAQAAAHAADLATVARLTSPADVMELRLMLEPMVMELTVSRASQSELDAMDDCLRQARSAATLEAFEHWDDMLHRCFAAASRNPLCVAVYALIGAVRLEAPWGELKRRTLTDALKKKHFDEHVRIVDAVRARDAQLARRLMQQHLEHIRRNMFGPA